MSQITYWGMAEMTPLSGAILTVWLLGVVILMCCWFVARRWGNSKDGFIKALIICVTWPLWLAIYSIVSVTGDHSS